MKEISVVLSTYSVNRLQYVLDCINSLRNQTSYSAEIILALDPDPQLVGFYAKQIPKDVKIVVGQGHGLSHARNAGIKSARGEIVAFIDDDAVADSNWLRNISLNYADPSVVCVGGFAKPSWDRRKPMWFPDECNWTVGCSHEGLPRYRTAVRNPIGCNMSFRKSIFGTVGLFGVSIGRFGKNLLSGEETEFCIRVLTKIPNSRIMFDPSIIVYHKVHRSRASLKYFIKRSFYEGFSIGKILNCLGESSSRMLSPENDYLTHLLRYGIPSRLKNSDLASITQIIVLCLSTFSVFVGFLSTRFS